MSTCARQVRYSGCLRIKDVPRGLLTLVPMLQELQQECSDERKKVRYRLHQQPITSPKLITTMSPAKGTEAIRDDSSYTGPRTYSRFRLGDSELDSVRASYPRPAAYLIHSASPYLGEVSLESPHRHVVVCMIDTGTSCSLYIRSSIVP